MSVRSWPLAACLLMLAALPCVAEPLDVKIGLWETAPDPTAHAVPQISEDALAKLSPEQRAMVQQRVAAAAAAMQKPHQFCLTEDMRQRGIGERPNGRCVRTVVSSTAQQLELHMECTGDIAATGTVRVSAADQQTMTIETDMTITRNGAATPSHHAIQSHWLAADCGDVKPMR